MSLHFLFKSIFLAVEELLKILNAIYFGYTFEISLRNITNYDSIGIWRGV